MDTPIAAIPENRTEKLRIAIKEFKGRRYLDIRIFVEPYTDEGQGRVATKKGVTLRERISVVQPQTKG